MYSAIASCNINYTYIKRASDQWHPSVIGHWQCKLTLAFSICSMATVNSQTPAGDDEKKLIDPLRHSRSWALASGTCIIDRYLHTVYMHSPLTLTHPTIPISCRRLAQHVHAFITLSLLYTLIVESALWKWSNTLKYNLKALDSYRKAI